MKTYPYRGRSARAHRKQVHNDRAKREAEQMQKDGKSIKIDHWNEEDEENNWLWIRVHFTRPIIPVIFKTDIEAVLSELFNEHL